MEPTPTAEPELSELSLHEIVRRLPTARETLLRYGLDLCCGGELPLARAAQLHGLELREILEDLERDPGA